MLSPYRVLDLTDQRGEIAGMILGDLGADVIRVEPSGGSAARKVGPFLDDCDPLDRSLQFQAFNRNKRSILLDLGQLPDRDTFFALVVSADFVLESAPPGELAGNGIDFDTLRNINPRIVHVQITPYGSDGPVADRVASDLTLSAMGGQAALQGSPDRPPVRISVPQVWRHTGTEAAAAALIAHRRMLVTGEAQFVDVSAQCAMTWTTMNAMDAFAIQGFDFERMGSTVQLGTGSLDPVFACADGHLVAVPSGGELESLLGHMLSDEVIDETWLEEVWETFDLRVALTEETRFSAEQVRDALARFFLLHTKHELYRIGLDTGATLAPVNNVSDLLEFDQLEARGAWESIKLPNGMRVKAPGVFVHANTTPLSIRRWAPRLDEHGAEIRAELQESPGTAEHTSSEELSANDSNKRPFEGLKVIDLTWVIAGPVSVRYLADHGATVIKVESELRPDGMRKGGPVRGDATGWNSSHFYGEFNAGKQCIQLNLKHPDALDIFRKLIRWADVFFENWAPGATRRLGIDYENCRKINPNLIMLSTSLMGQTGPAATVAGYGFHAAGMAGFYEVTGWPDQPPAGPWLAYTDVIAPRFIATLVTAALDHRRRTGEGQHIDASQFEMALQFLAPEIIETQTSGHIATRSGNRSRFSAPQGIYPCAGKDQWCAIAIDNDEQWQSLRKAMGDPEWARDAALESATGRLERQDSIDTHLAVWTGSRSPHGAMDELTAHGVPAGAVQRSSDLSRDPQYVHREFHRFHDHPEMGRIPYAGNQFRIPGYQAGPYSYAPLLGEHNYDVFRNIAGMSDEEIAAAMAAGIIQ